jgi:thioredoxin reductase
MTALPELERERWALVVVGGGPAAALQVHAGAPAGHVLVVSERWQSGMAFMGSESLQSYVTELDLDSSSAALRSMLPPGRVRPTAERYDEYVRQALQRSGARLVDGTVTGIDRTPDGFQVVIATADGERTARCTYVVLATGSRPSPPPPEWLGAGAVTYDVAYRWTDEEKVSRCSGRSLLVVGSGNSAMQTAALLASLAEDTTILATRYVGMFPFETDDRFAWRAPSALTCELVVKSGRDCAERGTETCVRFLVYERARPIGGEVVIDYAERANQGLLSRHSIPPRCRHVEARSEGAGRWRERRDLSRTTILWATGCVPVYPAVPLVDALARDERGYIPTDARGETAIRGLYLTGACSGQRAVNEMRPASPAHLRDEVTA